MLMHVFLMLLKIKLIITPLYTVQLSSSRRKVCRSTMVIEMLLLGVSSDVNHEPVNECSQLSIKSPACNTQLVAACTTLEVGMKHWELGSANGDDSGQGGPGQNCLSDKTGTVSHTNTARAFLWRNIEFGCIVGRLVLFIVVWFIPWY